MTPDQIPPSSPARPNGARSKPESPDAADTRSTIDHQSLLQHFAKVADAIDRLRRFVLDLAVKGKLVQQDPNDEPASELLERIEEEKTESQTGTPLNWNYTTIGEVLEFKYGKGLKKSHRLEKGPIPVFGSNGIVGYTNERLTDKASIIIGRKGSAGAVNLCHGSSWTTDVAYLVEIPPLFVPKYLFISLKTLDLDMLSKGVKPGLNRADAYPLPLAIPPLAEQHRIVAKVDELMALLERLEANRTAAETHRGRFTTVSLDRLTAPETTEETFPEHARFALDALPKLTARPDQIKTLRQTILDLAVRGKLVEQDPDDEPASELLKRIERDKKNRGVPGRPHRQCGIETLHARETPYAPPPNWTWAQLGDITISRDGERIPVSKAERQRRAKIYDYYGASGVIDKIDDYLFNKPLLLIGEDGANLINRSTPIAFIARGKYWVNNHAHVLDGLNEDYLRYIELFINAIDLKPYVTGTAQPKMNQAKMKKIPVALPPIAEQHRIVTKVDELMALCDRLETALAATDTTKQRLLEALLHEALPNGTDNLEVA